MSEPEVYTDLFFLVSLARLVLRVVTALARIYSRSVPVLLITGVFISFISLSYTEALLADAIIVWLGFDLPGGKG